MNNTDETDNRVRKVSSVRRNGWNRPTLTSAVDTLKAMLPTESATTSPNEALARELLRWLDVAPDEFIETLYSWPRSLPPVSGHLEKVCAILDGDEETMPTRLREEFPDPTAMLVELLNDLDEDERSTLCVVEPFATAILMLGELNTSDGIRFLLSCLEWNSEPGEALVRDALAKTTGLVEVVIEVWPTIDGYVRAVVLDVMARGGLHDDRVSALLSDWTRESTREDIMWCVFAVGDYAGSRTTEQLLHLLNRAFLDQQRDAADDVIMRLRALGVAPSPEQRANYIRIWPGESLLTTPRGARS